MKLNTYWESKTGFTNQTLITRYNYWAKKLSNIMPDLPKGVPYYDYKNEYREGQIGLKFGSGGKASGFTQLTKYKSRKEYVPTYILVDNFHKNSSQEKLDAILVHEMIHAYLCFVNPKAATAVNQHGSEFKEMVGKINSLNAGVTVTLTDKLEVQEADGQKEFQMMVLLLDEKPEAYYTNKKITPEDIAGAKRMMSKDKGARTIIYKTKSKLFDLQRKRMWLAFMPDSREAFEKIQKEKIDEFKAV